MWLELTILGVLHAGQALQSGPIEGREWLTNKGCHCVEEEMDPMVRKSRQADKQTNTAEHVKGGRRGLGLGALPC